MEQNGRWKWGTPFRVPHLAPLNMVKKLLFSSLAWQWGGIFQIDPNGKLPKVYSNIIAALLQHKWPKLTLTNPFDDWAAVWTDVLWFCSTSWLFCFWYSISISRCSVVWSLIDWLYALLNKEAGPCRCRPSHKTRALQHGRHKCHVEVVAATL